LATGKSLKLFNSDSNEKWTCAAFFSMVIIISQEELWHIILLHLFKFRYFFISLCIDNLKFYVSILKKEILTSLFKRETHFRVLPFSLKSMQFFIPYYFVIYLLSFTRTSFHHNSM
jgi:hypothetical protein